MMAYWRNFCKGRPSRGTHSPEGCKSYRGWLVTLFNNNFYFLYSWFKDVFFMSGYYIFPSVTEATINVIKNITRPLAI